jgi:hypothetical protein
MTMGASFMQRRRGSKAILVAALALLLAGPATMVHAQAPDTAVARRWPSS